MLVVREQTVEEYLDYVRQHGTQNSRDSHGIPTLCSAIDKFRSVYLLEELLKDGADVNAFSCLKRAALHDKARKWYKCWGDFAAIHLAVSLAHYEIVKLLLDHGADLIAKTTKEIKPLDFLFNDSSLRCLEKDVCVSQADDFRILQLMVTAGVNLNAEVDFPQSTLLHRAPQLNNEELTRYLIVLGCDVNSVDVNGKTPLQYCNIDTVECARILLENGANPNAQDYSGNTVYHQVFDKYRYLENSNCPLHFLRLLHDFRVNPNVSNNVGQTALHISFEKITPGLKIEEVIDLMLKYGADPNVTDELDRTPVYYMIHSYSMANTGYAWKLLWALLINFLRHGAMLDIVDIIGISLLHFLVESCLSCTEYFDPKSFTEVLQPENKVEVNCLDLYHRTVLHLVSAEGNWKIAKILLNHGANVEIMDCDGNTPLHVAILCEKWEFARNLLLWPLRNTKIVNTSDYGCISLSNRHQFHQIRRNNSVPVFMHREDNTSEILKKKNASSFQCPTKEFSQDGNERSDHIHQTMSLRNSLDQHVKWTPKKLDIIVEYLHQSKIHFLDTVEPEVPFCDVETWPAPTIRRDFLDQINKSSLFQLYEENSMSEFHLIEKCEEEHCLIAKQVFRLMKDLVQKCSEIDPRMESKLLWTGSTAEGTKMWLPDEFDFLMELVQLRGNFIYDNALNSSSDVALVRKECQVLWSNLCLYKDSYTLSLTKLQQYISALLWKAAFLLERKKYKNIRYRLCQYNKNHPIFIKRTKVGVNINVCWFGRKYKKLIISIDLTPAIPVSLTKEKLLRVHKHSVGRLVNNYIHVIPYVKRAHQMWRPSFSLSEVHIILKSFSQKQIALYKWLKFLRDIYKDVSAGIPSYYLKTFLFNYFLLDNGDLHAFHTESEDFYSGLCDMLHRLSQVACSQSHHRKIQHFFLDYRLDLADYDTRWIQSALSLLENS